MRERKVDGLTPIFHFKAAADFQNGFLEENLSIGFLPHYSSTGYIVFAVIYRNNNAKYNAMSGWKI
ncbi:uncharacterized protein Dvar_73450 [Desulfosarcina variabilis str. Montpellier]|uniref:hypothetical protein n=1 Tax=Desulfosarcina variabilis TaxID=2300 RepID=UPI003AFAC351